MDVTKLRSTISELVGEESKFEIESEVTRLDSNLQNLSANPGQQEFQVQLAKSLADLRVITSNLRSEHDPVFRNHVLDIGGLHYFSKLMSDQLDTAISQNAMTPAVAQQAVAAFKSERSAYVQQLNSMLVAMKQLTLGEEEIQAGAAQVGFRLPRELFNNELEGWINELRDLRRIVRAFSELATGAAEPIKIGEISTTDPLIFFVLATPTVAAVAKAVSWSLDQWKKVEEIRKLRVETAKLSESMDGQMDELVAKFDARIEASVATAIENHARELVQPGVEPGRAQEQLQDITFALRGLVARIERGMTVELKFLPPPEEILESNQAEAAAFAVIEDVVPRLSFPQRSQAPVIALPGPDAGAFA